MTIKAGEISQIIKSQIQNYQKVLALQEVGQVLSVGDGVCRAYGLDEVMAGELVSFSDTLFGMVLIWKKIMWVLLF